MDTVLKKYENSKGLEKDFWLGFLLATYSSWTGSKLASKAANEIYEKTEAFMLNKYCSVPFIS